MVDRVIAMDTYLKTIAEGGEFDVVEAIRVLARAAVALPTPGVNEQIAATPGQVDGAGRVESSAGEVARAKKK